MSDLISRQAAIDLLDENDPMLRTREYYRKMIAELPSVTPQPCEDAISREEVIDEINRIGVKAFETYNDYSELFDFVDSLPSVSTEKTGRWIPVSEKLPEIGQYVLCSLIKAEDVKHRVVICKYKREVWWSYVTAWMPLPQPYYAESEE